MNGVIEGSENGRKHIAIKLNIFPQQRAPIRYLEVT